LPSNPYYRSTYVFVTRQNRGIKISSFDELILRTAKIGIQLVGDDGVNTPPAHALANRGIVTNVVGFTLYGDYREANPPARIVEAVGRGDLDVAIVWGPLAGYFNRAERLNLDLTPVSANSEDQPLKFDFSMAMGVRRGNQELREALNEIIRKHRTEIDEILKNFGVPLLPLKETVTKREDL
jgi:ABC-type amino acid transport substrate-binding protein